MSSETSDNLGDLAEEATRIRLSSSGAEWSEWSKPGDAMEVFAQAHPEGPQQDWFAPKTVAAGLLDRRTVHKLGLIWLALYHEVHEPDLENAGKTKDVPLLGIEVEYQHLTDVAIFYLESKGIPARSNAPLDFRYPEVLAPSVPDTVNRERFFNNLVDVLYCFWSIEMGFHLFMRGGYPQAANESARRQQAMLDVVARQQGVSAERAREMVQSSMDTNLMRGKWYADNVLVRERAMWDKMLKLLGRDFYGVELRQKEWADRVSRLSRDAFEPMAAGPEKDFLEGFLVMCGELGKLREYRDNDLHQTSPRIAEALGREDREINMLSVWNLMQLELLRCTEALLVCFGCILAHAGDAPPVTMIKK